MSLIESHVQYSSKIDKVRFGFLCELGDQGVQRGIKCDTFLFDVEEMR